MKVASFTVRGTMDQSIRWKRAAEAEGYSSAGSWLAYAADLYLKARARAGRPLPLLWRRGRFQVALEAGEVGMTGFVSPPFGAFRGDNGGKGRRGAAGYSLVHLPTRRIIATLRTYAQSKALASEIAPVIIRDEAGALKLAEQRERERA